MKINLVIFFLFLYSCFCYAHKDIWRDFEKNNVKSGIVTGFEEYQEINKVKIITELAAILSTELKYNKPLYLYFRHYYTDSLNHNGYYLNFHTKSKNDTYYKKNGIFLKFTGKEFNVINCLKLIEYAIKNVAHIPALEKDIYYTTKYYDTIHLRSIDTLLLQKEVAKRESTLIKNVAANKIYAFSENINIQNGYTYYWKSNKFHIEQIEEGKRKTVLSLNNITYFFNDNLWGNAVVFDSQFSFYTLTVRPFKISSKVTIDYKQMYSKPGFMIGYLPYNVELLDKSKFLISSYGPKILRTHQMLYWADKNIFIQDLDDCLLKNN